MPELPEVETVRRGLQLRVAGRTIVRVRVAEPRLRTPLDPAGLAHALLGRRIEALDRRAKYLLLQLDDGQVLVVHLGMTGRLLVSDPGAPSAPHTHVLLELEPRAELRFADPRRFGMLFVVPGSELPGHPRFSRLGPEPLGPRFDVAYLERRSRCVRRSIKSFLMDAAVVVGVGNIYATEALYRARVHPRTPAGRLGRRRLARVHAAVQAVLQAALRDGGTTLRDYRGAGGAPGDFQVRLRVYGREGQRCRRCRQRIRRIIVAGRSAFSCPGCQPSPRGSLRRCGASGTRPGRS